MQVLDSEQRLGAKDADRYKSIRSHPFYEGLNFDTLQETTPPPIYPYLPGVSPDSQELRSQYRVSISNTVTWVATSVLHVLVWYILHTRKMQKARVKLNIIERVGLSGIVPIGN